MRNVACVWILSLMAGSCAETPHVSEVMVHDSAGVRIVQIAQLEELELPVWSVAGDPVVIIGDAEGQPGHDLFGVRGGGVLSDGRIVVADGTSAQLRVFSPGGELVARIGRKGRGPGEFEALLWLQVVGGDTVYAYDYGLRRVSVFTSEGALAKSYGIAPPTEAGFPEPRGVLSNGSIVFVPGFDRRFGVGERRDTVPFFLYDRNGALVGRIAAFPGREEFFARYGEAAMRSEVPFGRDVLSAAGDDRILIGATDSYALSLFDASGALEVVIRAGVRARPVRASEVEAWKRGKLSALPAERRRLMQPLYEALPARETHPAFGAVAVDDGGMVWVERMVLQEGPSSTWEVFDASGEPAARVRLPAGLMVLEIGAGHVLALARDAEGREAVVLYALRRV